jgi:hypothetical protein
VKYSWPLPGEGTTSEELMMTEARTAIAGIANYSSQARRDAILAELIAALFNGTALVGPLSVTDVRPTRLGLVQVNLASTANSAVSVDVSAGTYLQVTVNSTGGYTINNPTNLYGVANLQQLVLVEVHNSSGGAITTTWAGNWHLAGAWTDPGNGKSRFGVFLQLNTTMQEVARSVADT